MKARPTDIDVHVGERIRRRRVLLGLTQQQVAETIGVTYQQSHKYEKGINRVAASRLYTFARVLGVDVGYFFKGIEDGEHMPKARVNQGNLAMTEAMLEISDPALRAALLRLAKAVAANGAERKTNVR